MRARPLAPPAGRRLLPGIAVQQVGRRHSRHGAGQNRQRVRRGERIAGVEEQQVAAGGTRHRPVHRVERPGIGGAAPVRARVAQGGQQGDSTVARRAVLDQPFEVPERLHGQAGMGAAQAVGVIAADRNDGEGRHGSET